MLLLVNEAMFVQLFFEENLEIAFPKSLRFSNLLIYGCAIEKCESWSTLSNRN